VPFLCPDPDKFADGEYHGESHECVGLVKLAAHAPQTAKWSPGAVVKEHAPTFGTAIATFDATGKYANIPGQSHAALFLGMDAKGIDVVDQFRGKPGGKRKIFFNPAADRPVNDANNYRVIEPKEPESHNG
jgi:hypothetical protein